MICIMYLWMKVGASRGLVGVVVEGVVVVLGLRWWWLADSRDSTAFCQTTVVMIVIKGGMDMVRKIELKKGMRGQDN